MGNIKSHIQPKFFLKGFLASKEQSNHVDSVFVYKKGMPFKPDGPKKERNPARTGIDNMAYVTNFYGFRTNDGKLDAETYEKRLQNEVEQPANDTLKRLREVEIEANEIIKIDDLISTDERRAFARYVGGMYARTERSKNNHFLAIKETVEGSREAGYSYAEIVENIPPEQAAKLEQYVDSINPGFDKKNGRLSMPEKVFLDFKNEKETDESFAKGIFRSIDLVGPIIFQMKWQIRRVTNQHGFFTGDDPVTWNYIRDPDAMLLFPISSNTIFCGFNNQSAPERVFVEKDEKYVERVRSVFAEKCQQIYFSKQAKWLVEYFNKR